jgi:hypothetical protein
VYRLEQRQVRRLQNGKRGDVVSHAEQLRTRQGVAVLPNHDEVVLHLVDAGRRPGGPAGLLALGQ